MGLIKILRVFAVLLGSDAHTPEYMAAHLKMLKIFWKMKLAYIF